MGPNNLDSVAGAMMTTAKNHPNPFTMKPLGPHLQDLLMAFIDQSVPILKIKYDRSEFYPGAAFDGLAVNAKRQIWRAHLLSGVSEPTEWFSLFLDAIGIWWTVDYKDCGDGRVSVSAGEDRFYWSQGTSGLAMSVLRPLFMDWMIKLALAGEFGPDTLQGIAQDPILLAEYREYLGEIDRLLARYQIERSASNNAAANGQAERCTCVGHPKRCSIAA